MRKLLKSILFFLLVLPAPLGAQKIIVLEAQKDMEHVGQYSSYFLDSTAKLSVDEIASPALRKHFKAADRTQINIPITSSVLWIHFYLTSKDHGPWYVQLGHPLTDNVKLYRKSAAGWQTSDAGYDFSFAERDVRTNTIVFPLDLEAGDTAEYYVRMQSASPMGIMLRTGTADDFWQMQTGDSLFSGLFFGIMLVMILYNLFLFVTNRDRVYIYYVLYVLSSVIFISFASGYVYFFPDIIRASFPFNRIIFPFLFGLFGLFFTRRFLNTAQYVPRLDKVIYVLFFFVAITVIIDFFNGQLAIMLIQFLGIVLTILCMVIGFTVLRKGYGPARYYLLGFCAYLLGLSSYILVAVLNVDLGNMPPAYLLMAGSAVEAIILSFAIGDKLNMALHEKQLAQDKALDAMKENDRIIREQNIVLEEKVRERTAEIEEQKAIIEEKNKDILDSIHYAKRIQRALLASGQMLSKNLPEYFVFYRPKDIVSGDFYWADEIPGGKFLMITGDCTGHGVPGAFMSLLNISILHEITSGMKIYRPDEILNTQREAIIMSLNPPGSGEISKDGMDCTLCSFDSEKRKLEFACANNPLWIVRKGELIEYRPDKFPIGIHEGETKPFTLHQADLLPGDIVYTFTDGYADQFGGPKGKKFKYSQLKEKLLALSSLPMQEQKEELERIFDSWKGNLEQIDDVLLIGVKV